MVPLHFQAALARAFGPGRVWLARMGMQALAIGVIVWAVVAAVSVEPRPLSAQPGPDAQEYADAARQMAEGNGYVTVVHGNVPRPPRYPPGFSLALEPFAAWAGSYPANVQRGALSFAALYVVAAAGAAWSVAGPLAGALTAALIGFSPFARTSAQLVLSDALAAGGTVLLLGLLCRLSVGRVALAGALAGLLVWIRLSMVLNVIALLLAVPARHRLRVVVFGLPPLLALALYNCWAFGSPWQTGYDYWLPHVKNFDWSFAVSHRPTDGPWIVADSLDGRVAHRVFPWVQGHPQAFLPNALLYPSQWLACSGSSPPRSRLLLELDMHGLIVEKLTPGLPSGSCH